MPARSAPRQEVDLPLARALFLIDDINLDIRLDGESLWNSVATEVLPVVLPRRPIILDIVHFQLELSKVNSVSDHHSEYDLIVVYQYDTSIFPITFFSSAACHLTSKGRLIFVRPLVSGLRQGQDLSRTHHYLASIAGRCGLDWCEPTALDHYSSWNFQKAEKTPRWYLVEVNQSDFPRFAMLFQRAFGSRPSLKLWQWKYDQGRGAAVGAILNGAMVAHYGGTRRRAVWGMRTLDLWQICDVMVEPAERGVMTRHGVMYRAAATFFEAWFGLAEADFAYGFPSRRHQSLGERLKLYQEMDRMMELRWSPQPENDLRRFRRWRYLRPACATDQEWMTKLWRRMRQDLVDRILIERDWAYIQYRYMDHPEHHYEFILLLNRLTRKPRGLLVLRRHEEDLELLDVVAPLSTLPDLIALARGMAKYWHLKSLYCWITASQIRYIADEAAQVRDLDISMPVSVWVPPEIPPSETRGKWWLMSGDTDFH